MPVESETPGDRIMPDSVMQDGALYDGVNDPIGVATNLSPAFKGESEAVSGNPALGYPTSQGSIYAPVPLPAPRKNNPTSEGKTVVPREPVWIVLDKPPSLPTADKSGLIQIAPTPEEKTAFDQLIKSLPASFGEKENEVLLRAYLLASYAHRLQKRETGEPYILHPIAVTQILCDLYLDVDTLAAGLLHDVAEDTEFNIEYIREHFSPTIAMMVDGVTKLKRINELSSPSQGNLSDSKAESLRKMFLAMVDDVRVVLIKLADRLHNMRTLGGQKEHKRRRIARETLEIFAPLANRLGIWKIKSELEDLSFRYLEPAAYKDIEKAMHQKQDEREKFVIKVKADLGRELTKAGIQAEISGRPKHIYSIWSKMKRKGVGFAEIYDAQAFRVIVASVTECYGALGIVHSLWRPIPHEFDDYIANPKNNNYRSLHTAVQNHGQPMEVQFRTREMDETAEHGIAAHWQYKEGVRHDANFQDKIKWLRQIMDQIKDWRQEVTNAEDFVNSMKTDVFRDRVFAFTPQGEVIDLPAGATPVDFAYQIHSELGHRCRGASINGRLVALDYKLNNGDQVSIMAAKQGGPSRDWLNPTLEIVNTQRARSKIKAWLRKQGRDENILRGRQSLEREMKRLSVTMSIEALGKLCGYEKVDDFLAAIGYGDVSGQQIAQKVLESERIERERQAMLNGVFNRPTSTPVRQGAEGLVVQGVEGLLTQIGRCCNPLPGDGIVGFVTKGRGITVHRVNCHNAKYILTRGESNRLVDVQWTATLDNHKTYSVKISISAYDRAGLVRDVAGLVADEHINMSSVEALTGQKDNLAVINATLEIADTAQLMKILLKIERLPNIVQVRRALG